MTPSGADQCFMIYISFIFLCLSLSVCDFFSLSEKEIKIMKFI